MKRICVLSSMVALTACGGGDRAPSSVSPSHALPKVASVGDVLTARRAATMSATLRHEPKPRFGGRGTAATARINGSAPSTIIPGVDDQ